MIRFRAGFIAIACIVTGACDQLPTLVPASSEFRNAPEEVSLGGASIQLDTYLWRDFQPIAPPDGKPLVAALRIHTVDGGSISATLHADSVWILSGDLAWAAALVEERPRESGASFFDVVAREGPKWGPGIDVDVVVGLRDAAGHRVLLQARRQPIHRTD
jgi:hypothetical protein